MSVRSVCHACQFSILVGLYHNTKVDRCINESVQTIKPGQQPYDARWSNSCSRYDNRFIVPMLPKCRAAVCDTAVIPCTGVPLD